MALAPIVEAVPRIHESAQFTGLTNAGRAAINNYTDDVQFLSACVDAGGVTYGRSSSHAAESQNHHLAGAQSQDLVSSVLWVMKFEARRYQEWAGKSARETSYAPPSVRRRMENFSNVDASGPLGEAGGNAALSDEYTNVLQCQRLLSVATMSHFHSPTMLMATWCRCLGHVAAEGHRYIFFLCKHIYTAAITGHYDERKHITIELTTAKWKSQYPSGHSFVPMTREDLIMPGAFRASRDEYLRVPIKAPTKRGRPPTNPCKISC